jgi:hypothetical protein
LRQPYQSRGFQIIKPTIAISSKSTTKNAVPSPAEQHRRAEHMDELEGEARL